MDWRSQPSTAKRLDACRANTINQHFSRVQKSMQEDLPSAADNRSHASSE